VCSVNARPYLKLKARPRFCPTSCSLSMLKFMILGPQNDQTRQKLSRVFNSRYCCFITTCAIYTATKQPNLKLKTWLWKHFSYLQFNFALSKKFCQILLTEEAKFTIVLCNVFQCLQTYAYVPCCVGTNHHTIINQGPWW
jgi:hypothetical protein